MLQTLPQEFGPCTVMDVSRVYLVLQKRALCVDEQMTLAAVDLFAAVIAAGSAGFRRLDRLASLSRRIQSSAHIMFLHLLIPAGLTLLSVISAWAVT